MKITTIISVLILCVSSFSSWGYETGWPRTFNNADGSKTVIHSAPKRVISTSVTVTGTLLAIDAPLYASALGANGRFFEQWEQLANKKGIEQLWPAGSVDLEAAYMAEPDLIVVSYTGADSALDQVKELSLIAPTIVVDYARQPWQEMAVKLGFALGLEKQAENTINTFDAYVAESREKLNLPVGKANIISFQGAGVANAIGRPAGPHAQLLSALGFEIEAPNPDWHTGIVELNDFVRVHYENLTHLTADTTFLLAVGDSETPRFLNDPILQNLPSIKNQQVYPLGENSFRIDLFSAKEIVEGMVKRFGQHSENGT